MTLREGGTRAEAMAALSVNQLERMFPLGELNETVQEL